MKLAIGKIVIFILLCVFFSENLHAQDSKNEAPKNQIEIRHDNDFLLFTDRYYSSGLLLTYRRRLSQGIFSKENEQLTFQLKQQAYTPENIKALTIEELNHPFAEFLGLEAGWSMSKNNTLLESKLLIGITGASAGAGGFQRWYHATIMHTIIPTWFAEIESSFHVNFEASYVKEWQLNPNPFSVHFALKSTLALGTKDIYAHPEFIAYFGRRNVLNSSIAYHQINSTQREVYIALRAGYRFVAHNALLEGNLLGDNSVYTIEPKTAVLHLGFDLCQRFKKNDYKISFYLLSKESKAIDHHQYLTVSYARSF